MKVTDSTTVEIKDEAVVITRPEVKSTLTHLKEAIAHTLDSSGFYISTCEPSMDVTDYDEEVTVTLNKEFVGADELVDDHFIKQVIRRLEKQQAKENNNG